MDGLFVEAEDKNVSSSSAFLKMSAPQRVSVINQYFAAIVCSILAIIYGQSVAWSSSATPFIQQGHGPGGEVLSAAKTGWIGGAFCLGALFSAPFHGMIADWKGRKFAGYVVAFCFVVNWTLMLLATNFWWILAARAFGGAGGAGSITIATIYNNEISTTKMRSVAGTIMTLFYAFGLFSGFVLGPYLSFDTLSMLYLAICLVFFPAFWSMPESPAYSLLKGDEEKSWKAIQWLQKVPELEAKKLMEMIKAEQAGAVKTASIIELFKNEAARKGLFIGSVLIFVQTFCGIFACTSYAVEIFTRAEVALAPHISTIIYGAMMIVGAVCPPMIADRAPRKIFLITSSGMMGLLMGILALQQWAYGNGLISRDATFLRIIPAILLPSIAFFFYLGLGSVIYIVLAEIFTDEFRAIGNGFFSVVIWSTSYFLLQFFGVSVEAFGDFIVFGFFAFICLFGMLFVIFVVPETRGKSCTEVVEMLTKKKSVSANF